MEVNSNQEMDEISHDLRELNHEDEDEGEGGVVPTATMIKKWDLSQYKPDDQGKFLSNMEDPDDIKDDNDYLALKLERRRSYPFVESELHLGKLLRIRSQVNDRL